MYTRDLETQVINLIIFNNIFLKKVRLHIKMSSNKKIVKIKVKIR